MNCPALTRIACIAGLFIPATYAQKQEVGLTLGRIFSQQRSSPPGDLQLGGGIALQANYGYRVFQSRTTALYLEAQLLANPLRDIKSTNTGASRDVATLFVTPGIRVKFLRDKRFSPYAAVGGGYAWFQQSTTTIGGQPNDAPRNTYRGALDFGGGIDAKLWRLVGLRFDLRDYYTGNPSFNAPVAGSGQHNFVTSGGFVLRFGEKE
jgi:opacity protein-like surface antigen